MTGYIPPKQLQRTEGHFPNTGNTVEELHRLLAMFLASQHFSKPSERYFGEGFDPIHRIQYVEEDEITRILLNLAVTARVVDDRKGRIFKLTSSNCGTLHKDLRTQKIGVLDIREACNEIIHAQTVRFDSRGTRSSTISEPGYLSLWHLAGQILAGAARRHHVL